jgi:hypothetical protein
MAKSQRQLQAELLSEGYIDRRSRDSVDRNQQEATTVSELIAGYAREFIDAVRENLNKAGKVSTGALADGVDSGEVIGQGGKYTLEIGYEPNGPAAKYWDYVNKGVRGINSGQPADSPYFYKKLSAPPVMVEAIKGWMRTNQIAARNEDQVQDLKALQQKRKRLSEVEDPLNSFAYLTALKIKREGLPYTGYFDEPVAEYFGDQFAAAVAKAAGVDIRIAIRKFNPNRNA